MRYADHTVREAREETALRIIAISIFALAVYVTIDSVRALTGTGAAQHSTPGMVLAALSLVVMPFLSAAQRRTGREPGSAQAVADRAGADPRGTWASRCGQPGF